MKKITIYLTTLFYALFNICAFSAFGGQGVSNEELENYANNNFSSFEGNNFEGNEMYYTGAGDHFLDFGGANISFANERHGARQFIATITNANPADQVITLIPGYEWATGTTSQTRKILADGDIFTDGAGDVTGAGSPKAINEFLAYIAKNPCVLAGVKISSNNNADQTEQNLIVQDLSPFRNLQNNVIQLSQFTDENTFRDKVVTAPTPGVVIGGETEITLNIKGASVVTIIFYVGATLSTSAALKAKKSLASANIAAVGLPNIQASQAAYGNQLMHTGPNRAEMPIMIAPSPGRPSGGGLFR